MVQGQLTSPEILCDMVIDSKNYVSALHPVHGTELPKPLEFLSGESDKGVSCYVNEVILEKKLPVAGRSNRATM